MTSSSNSNGNKKGQRFWLLGDTYTFRIKWPSIQFLNPLYNNI